MSGGSYDYLYSRMPDQLRQYASALVSMAENCEERAATGRPEEDWQSKTNVDLMALAECGAYLRALSFRMTATANLMEKWSDIMHAVEWWCSGDSGIAEVVFHFNKLKALVLLFEGEK